MAESNLILIDTCIWLPFFNRPHSDEKRHLDRLLDENRAAITGEVLYEILVGFRRNEQADWVASALFGVALIEPTWDEWRAGARLVRELRARGHSIPLTDVLLSAVALERGCAVYTIDPHFDLIPRLLKFHPE
ncbi:MAG: PIN domain-containing protein [Planctomycetota bacterium]|nr:MAG: PIN domain-containing protein [Planctomycetota bacterium]REK28150.1 MAG: PIN domain-containing protein [Planctomycetota bacterium]REK36045.1 MAG: PIN domain-containing protein [Planctomycetota bacterium]